MTTTNKQVLKIFIVEDEFIVMENIKLDVKSFGYEIVGTASNGIDAIEGILKEKPDLILMDINLKGSLSGIDVARRIKGESIPVVFITAYADEKTLETARSLGAYGFLIKPFQALDLKSSIEMAIGKSETLKEIEDQKETTDKKLIATKRNYKTIIENVSDLIYTTDNYGFIKYVNQAAAKIVGFTNNELIGMNIRNFVKGEYRKKIDSVYRLAHEGREENIYLEVPVITKDKKEIWVGQNITAIREDGRLIGFQGVARNIDNRIQFEEELIRAKEEAEETAKLKSQFLANMSHEIRTPLNGIVGIGKLLKDTELNEKQTEYVKAIISSSHQLMGIVNNILDLSKLDAEKMTVDLNTFDFQELISGIEAIYEKRAGEKGVKFACICDDYIPKYLIGDSIKINQILHNLIGNALKFTKDGSVLVTTYLKSQDENQCVVGFKISDTGIGIPEEKIHDVFQAFVQSNSSTSREFGGTGLGLAIVDRLVKLLGGTIELQSAMNKGTTFTVEIPLKSANQEEIEASIKLPDHNEYNLSGTRVLLVEDNKVNQIVTSDLLKSQNCKVEICNNGKEAVEEFIENDYDIILMDMQMPVMDGYTAMRIIRNEIQAEKRNVPIIALTAHAFQGELDKCKESGATDYMSKPFEPTSLFRLMGRLLQLKSTPSKGGNDRKQNEDNDDTENPGMINFQKLSSFLNGNTELMLTTLIALKESFEEDIPVLTSLKKDRIRYDIKRTVHRIKPNFEMIGSDELHKLCLKIEQNDDIDENIQDLEVIIKGIQLIVQSIDDFLQNQENLLTN